MSLLLRAVDWQADLIRRLFTPKWQMRAGVAMLDLSILFAAYAPLSGEKPGVYWMSQLALMFGGIIMVTGAALAEKEERKRRGG